MAVALVMATLVAPSCTTAAKVGVRTPETLGGSSIAIEGVAIGVGGAGDFELIRPENGDAFPRTAAGPAAENATGGSIGVGRRSTTHEVAKGKDGVVNGEDGSGIRGAVARPRRPSGAFSPVAVRVGDG